MTISVSNAVTPSFNPNNFLIEDRIFSSNTVSFAIYITSMVSCRQAFCQQRHLYFHNYHLHNVLHYAYPKTHILNTPDLIIILDYFRYLLKTSDSYDAQLSDQISHDQEMPNHTLCL